MDSEQPIQSTEKVEMRKATSLDQLIQILEICFIFLVTFSLVALADSTLEGVDLYAGLNGQLGVEDVGNLAGGNFEQIVRVTLIFNLLLFAFSLFFGIWMRRTRDNWAWTDFGYTFNTPGYPFKDLVRRAVLLGTIGIVVFFVVLAPIFFSLSGPEDRFLIFAYAEPNGQIYNSRALNAEYYFGFVEMGFIWPLSAGFFFFAYAYNSLKAKFQVGVANILATSFYVFYLVFFFIIKDGNKIYGLKEILSDPSTYRIEWGMAFVFFIVLYINFSSFAETKSIVLPFMMNFVWNVGLTLIRALNSIIFYNQGSTPLMLLIPLVSVLTVVLWYFLNKDDFSTISIGWGHLKEAMNEKKVRMLGFFLLFIVSSFLLPGIIQQTLFSGQDVANWVIPTLYAADFLLIIFLAVLVLTYEPTDVWDVLLISNDGTPVASHIELFETDEVLISGFFTALASVSQEIDGSKDAGLTSVKRGQREILIENGVYTRIIALADKDQSNIRRQIQDLHRDFEIRSSEDEIFGVKSGKEAKGAKELVDKIGELSIEFAIPQQTKWLATLAVSLGPLMLILIGLL